ncbi:MAG: hypothetical protein IPF54_27050 [Draconibacterium sp.]|nr:hypothetical protein [Draconibacterium sp.]
MKGEEVKKILEEDGLQLTDVAERLNISHKISTTGLVFRILKLVFWKK